MPKRFPTELLVISEASIYAMIFENRRVGVERGLFFCWSVSFEPIEIDGEEELPTCIFEFFRLGAHSWPDLAGREFPVPNLESFDDGEASMYLDGEHQPLEVPELRFGRLDGNRLGVSFRAQVNPQSTFDKFELTLSTQLLVEGLLIGPSIISMLTKNSRKAREVAAPFFELSGHGEPDFSSFWTKFPFLG